MHWAEEPTARGGVRWELTYQRLQLARAKSAKCPPLYILTERLNLSRVVRAAVRLRVMKVKRAALWSPRHELEVAA